MRAYYFFMKFMRSFGIGLLCGTAAALFISAVVAVAVKFFFL